MSVQRDVGDISTNPGGKSGAEWTSGVRSSVLGLWALNGGVLDVISGTNAIVASVKNPSGFTSYGDGLRVGLIALNTNTGAMTLNINNVGVKAWLNQDGAAMVPGSVVAGKYVEAVFDADSDAFRLVSSSGTTNVTVDGGILRRRSPVARRAASTGPTTSETVIASVTFQCEGANGIVVIEGCTTRVTGAGSPDPVGVSIRLYVNNVLQSQYTDHCVPDQHASTQIYFTHQPGTIDPRTYEVRVVSAIAATYPAGSNMAWLSEISPNS